MSEAMELDIPFIPFWVRSEAWLVGSGDQEEGVCLAHEALSDHRTIPNGKGG